MDVDKLSISGRDNKVAGERERRAEADRISVDACDNRLLDLNQRLMQSDDAGECPPGSRWIGKIPSCLLTAIEVGSHWNVELILHSGDDHHTNIVSPAQGREDLSQIPMEIACPSDKILGRHDTHRRDLTIGFDFARLELHLTLLAS